MPYSATTPSLPFAGSLHITPRCCSRRAAEQKARTLTLRMRRYLACLLAHPMVTDPGAVELTGLPLQSICSVRNAAIDRGFVIVVGETMGSYGFNITLYGLSVYGRHIAAVNPVGVVEVA